MVFALISSLLAVAVIAFILVVRPSDIPEPEPVSPFLHLDERRAAIYENLRDLQFEFRVGKLSDDDYQHTKQDLQKELALVMAEIDNIKAGGKAGLTAGAVAKVTAAERKKGTTFTCDACGANFSHYLKFCGECGKPMKVAQ